MIHTKNGINFIDVNYDFFEKYLSIKPSITLDPFINGPIWKSDLSGYTRSNEYVPFEHDFFVDQLVLYQTPEFLEILTDGKVKLTTYNYLLFGKFSNVTDKENISKIFLSGYEESPFGAKELCPYCSLLLRKDSDKYKSIITLNSYLVDPSTETVVYNTPFIVGTGNDLRNSLDDLDRVIEGLGTDKIVNLIEDKKDKTNLTFDYDSDNNRLSLKRNGRK